MTEQDAQFAQLASIFENASDAQILKALEKAERDVTRAIDVLLVASTSAERKGSSSRTNFKSLPSETNTDKGQEEPPCKKLKPELNAFQLLSDQPSSQKKVLVTSDTIHRHLPCVLILEFLPQGLAQQLLVCMLEEAKNWKVRKFSLFEKTVQSPHTTNFYVDSTRVCTEQGIPDTDTNYGGIPGHNKEHRLFFPKLTEARDLIQARVNQELGKRTRDSLEIQGEWVPNVVVANQYIGHEQGVGAHADRLTYIGPRPTIASLTLGAERIFRVKSIKRDPVSGMQKTCDVRLPHNSLLIMFPPMQEEYKHEVPKCQPQSITHHSIGKNTRINLTFRVARPEYCSILPTCECGNPCDLRVVSKKEKNFGKYFYLCAGAGSEKLGLPQGHSCGFFQWLNVSLK